MDRSDIEKKWTIEIPKTANKIIVVGVYGDREVYAYSVDVHDLDSYAEPDTEKIREEAYTEAKIDAGQEYENGYDAGHNVGYQQGLSDAWEAARKICLNESDGGLSGITVHDIFNTEHYRDALRDYTPAKAIEKIRQYEQEEEEIKVGDEVWNIENGWIAVVCNIEGECMTLMDTNGALGDGYHVNRFTKTGRHFPEIAEVLRKMMEE